jgi:ABC-type transport system substrate-binding protein
LHDPNLQVLTFPNPRNVMLEMNNKVPPFDKKEVRQAVSYAVPYDSILKDVMHGYAQPNRSIVGAGMPGSDFKYWHYNTDLKKAADKLTAAGYQGGIDLPPGQYRFEVATFTANFLTICRIPTCAVPVQRGCR